MKVQLLIIISLITTCLSAQEVLDTNPPSIKWSQINTPNFRILFPRGFDERGQRMANTLEHIHAAEARSLGTLPRKLSVILQNQTSVSNGFVSILPRRSEFYAMPSQDYNFIGTNDWLNTLAAHEYRHVVQYAHATRGFNRLAYYLFGSTTLAGLSQAAAPSWFWEGDAVATETAFTHSGRGKIPNFALAFKTNLLEGREFNYHKQYLRSYKHFIPDHYVLGYHMVGYLRKRTNDPEIWGKVTARSWNVPFIPFAFSNAIKNKTGLYVTDLYREMVKDLKHEWQGQIDQKTFTDFTDITERKGEAYTDYQYPQELADGNVVVMRSGIGDIAQFVILNKNKEVVFTPGFINDSGMLSAHGSTIVWSEYGYDPRWRTKNYSLIKAYSLKHKKRYVIGGRKERYGSAAISPDETKIIAVRTDTDYKTQLVILTFPDGRILKTIPNPENYFYSMPRWSDDGSKIVVLKTSNQGKALVIINPEDDVEQTILPYGQENFGYPVLHKNYVFFSSPINGIDNIYAVDLHTNKRYQLTESKYGAFNPAVAADGKTIYYNDQTRDGLNVVKIPLDTTTWRKFSNDVQPQVYEQVLVEQEGRETLLDSVPQIVHSVAKYTKIKGLINPYTWGFYVNNDLTQANVGITSQDLLSTTRVDVGYNYDINERVSAWRAAVSYQGLFPIIDVSASLANRSVNEGTALFYDTLTTPTSTYYKDIKLEWKEKNLQAGVRIPLIATSSKYSTQLAIGNYVGLTQVTEFKNNIDSTFTGRIIPTGQNRNSAYFLRDYIDQGNLVYNQFNISGSRLLKRSRRDINSRWGQVFNIWHYATPYGGDYDAAEQFSFTGVLYFPGLVKHHSLWGYWAYQKTKIENVSDNYIFRNRVPFPRGYSSSRFQEFYSMSVNYTLPIWYPDIALGPVVNIQRLRANLFADYGFGRSQSFNQSRDYNSVGVEASLDINIFRFLPQLDIGVRYSYGINPSATKFEFLLGTLNL